MALKEWFSRLQPMQLYLVLFLTSVFFAVELVTSHITHALTLLVNAYHMLCNIIALIGCIASIKYSNRENYHCSVNGSDDTQLANVSICVTSDENFGSVPSLSTRTKESRSERRMKNTFGWARINILTMLVCCVFLTSFCFTLQVEALQTLVHIDQRDAMHQPIAVLCIGAAGIFLNLFCYILIGGYTFYHGSSLHVTTNGEVIIKRNIGANSSANGGDRQLSTRLPGRQGVREMCRDVLGCVFVMLVAVLVQYADSYVGKFIDPVIAIVSSTSLFVLSYPYMKESGLILLQTIPNHININSLKKELLEAFPGIVNVHDLHVWQLTGAKVISTAHIIFLDPTVYASIRHEVTAFFVEMGITQVTIQPEFKMIKPDVAKIDCLIRCQVENCSGSQCCSKDTFAEDSDPATKLTEQSHGLNKKFEKKEIIPALPSIDLKHFAALNAAGSSTSTDSYLQSDNSKNIEQNSEDDINHTCSSSSAVIDVDFTTTTYKDPEVILQTVEKELNYEETV